MTSIIELQDQAKEGLQSWKIEKVTVNGHGENHDAFDEEPNKSFQDWEWWMLAHFAASDR